MVTFKRPLWIFFDLDDTIWDFKKNSMISLRQLYDSSSILKKYFKTFDELDIEYHIHNSYLWDALSRGEISSHDLKAERWRRTLLSKSNEVMTEICEELDRNYLDILASIPNVMANAHEVLARLQQKVLIGVISNGFAATQYQKVRFSGLWRYITRIIVSEEIGKAKPDKALFHYAESETGAVAPHIMVGDNLTADVIGAMKAGWYAIWMNPEAKDHPDISKLSESHCFNPSFYLGSVKTLEEVETILLNLT